MVGGNFAAGEERGVHAGGVDGMGWRLISNSIPSSVRKYMHTTISLGMHLHNLFLPKKEIE